jgi:hypothetical protein
MFDGFGRAALHLISDPDGIDNLLGPDDDLGDSANGLLFGPIPDTA